MQTVTATVTAPPPPAVSSAAPAAAPSAAPAPDKTLFSMDEEEMTSDQIQCRWVHYRKHYHAVSVFRHVAQAITHSACLLLNGSGGDDQRPHTVQVCIDFGMVRVLQAAAHHTRGCRVYACSIVVQPATSTCILLPGEAWCLLLLLLLMPNAVFMGRAHRDALHAGKCFLNCNHSTITQPPTSHNMPPAAAAATASRILVITARDALRAGNQHHFSFHCPHACCALPNNYSCCALPLAAAISRPQGRAACGQALPEGGQRQRCHGALREGAHAVHGAGQQGGCVRQNGLHRSYAACAL